MFEEFIGNVVKLTETGAEGEVVHYNIKLLEVDGTVIKISDSDGDIKIINMASPLFGKIEKQKGY